MATYTCPSLGDCERGMLGELFERGPGEDLHCPQCNTLLELKKVDAPIRKPIKPALIAGIVGAAVVVFGGGATFYYKHTHAADAQTSVAAAESSASSIAPASEAALSSASAATVETAATAASETTETTAGGIAPSSSAIAADRAAGDQKLLNADAAGAATAGNQAAAKEMIKVAIAEMAQGKLDDAEKQLDDAEARDPKQSLVYYNLGVLRLKQARTDDALKQFEASFLNGFDYYDQMAKDPDLDAIRQDPRFVALVKKYRPATKT